MTTSFLYQFAVAVLTKLLERDRIEIRPGAEERVASFASNALASAPQGAQAIATLYAALIACPEVEELYADEEELKEIVDDLAT